MKRLFTLSFATIIASIQFINTTMSAVSVRYYNQDSKSYDLPVKCGSSFNTSSRVSFGSSRTASTTIQGPSPCKVTISNTVILKGGEKIKIKNGTFTLD